MRVSFAMERNSVTSAPGAGMPSPVGKSIKTTKTL